MAQDLFATLIAALAAAPRLEARSRILKQIKHQLIGHDHRKEAAVQAGLIEPIGRIIADHASYDVHSVKDAITIVGSLAAAGPQIVAPLVAANLHTHLCGLLTPELSDEIRTASLVALKNISAVRLTGKNTSQAELLTVQSVLHIKDLLSAGAHTSKLFLTTLSIISNAARDNATRNLLLEYGIIDLLAALLVAWTVKHYQLGYHGDSSSLPQPPPTPMIAMIVNAVNAILEGSCYRTEYFMHLPVVGNICVTLGAGSRHAVSSIPTVLPELLPSIAAPPQKNVSFHSGFTSFTSATSPATKLSQEDGDASHANAVTSWLLVIVRGLHDSDRLSTLALIAFVEAAIRQAQITTLSVPDAHKTRERERHLAHLATPLAVQQIQSSWAACQASPFESRADDIALLARSCRTLALLISPSKEIQGAAVDASALKTICSALKMCFKPIALSKPTWSPALAAAQDVRCTLGDPGLPAEVSIVMDARTAILHAVQAIADKDDSHRKQLVENNIIPIFIEALKPMSDAGLVSTTRVIEGNRIDVVLATCAAIQSLSRSVSLLRTSLIDAGIVKPVFELLQHHDFDIRMAATGVCTNLLVDSSPMRGDLLELGVVKVLADHCKSGPPSMTLSSLWALKHAVLQWPGDKRISMLNEIGTDWLMDAAHGRYHDVHNGISSGGVALSSANAAGEQIDLLNPSNMDVDGPMHAEDDEDDDDDEDYKDDGELLYDEASNTHYQDSSIRSTLQHSSAFDVQKFLTTLKSAENSVSLQARRDDIAIQEQALDFIRNFLNGSDCAPMVDHLFQHIGAQRLLELLVSKLSSPSWRRRTGTPLRPVPETLLAAMHVINHIVNGNASHKDALIRQRGLLDGLTPQLSHPDPRVRVMGVWIVVSLTWMDDGGDRHAAQARGTALRQSSIEQAVRNLVNDPELDIRERAKTAIRQFEAL